MPGPSGVRLKEGFPTVMQLSGATTLSVWENTVTPPGVTGGGANDTTNMRNGRYRTQQPKKLVTMTNMTVVAQYDPSVYIQVVAQIQVNQEITVFFPDFSTLTFWGWLDSFEPQEIREGSPPLATLVVIPSNQDNTGAEKAPSYFIEG